MEVCDIVQEAVIKTILKEKKCKKAKWLSEKALQIAVKRREVKSKGEKERYKHLNADPKNMLSRLVITFLPRSKHLSISWAYINLCCFKLSIL